MRRKNIIAAIILIAFALVYGYLTANIPVRTLPNTPNSAFFPWINTVLMLTLSVWLLAQGVRQTPNDTIEVASGHRHRAIWALAAFVAYLVAMPGLGFILATVPFFAILMILYGERRPVWIGGGAIGATVLLYILFRHGFGVFLPRGLLAGIVA
ncbi:MAG: tripartite tricarboxylate transporter TctB family protein [Halocynthiibacter sp.]